MTNQTGRSGRRIFLLNPAGLEEIADWLQNLRQFWSSRLEALEAQLKEEKAK